MTGGYSFSLSESQNLLASSAEAFSREVIIPVAAGFDESGEFPFEIISQAKQLGLFNIIVPENLSGSGLSSLDAILVIEKLSYGCAGVTTSIVANDLALQPILIAGTDQQKERFVKHIAEKGSLASFCLSEPGAGSDAASLQSRLTSVKDGYFLTGSKQWITNGGLADQFTVFATTDPAKKHKGICCVVVDGNTPGITRGHHENKLGQRCSNTVSLNFNEVFVEKDRLIGGEGEGFSIAMKTLDMTRPMTAAIAVGIADRALSEALMYSKERKQFGQPIFSFQAIQHILADSATEIEAARLLTYQAAWLADQGQKNSLQSSMAKRFAADMAMKVTTDAVQVFGGYGYTKEYPVEKLMRDAKLMQIYEGTSQVQRIVIAKELRDS
ncbi:MAG TPA: acyl-CoA dehydrogenase family protein [Oligoflexia bacterium]|nr:acyl-CoA dehydrogenase family protein [Oligoflexia bacterium]HMP48217.1 acyl-CoA dehydrogenase family protein [Oligoflexia bacterium]